MQCYKVGVTIYLFYVFRASYMKITYLDLTYQFTISKLFSLQFPIYILFLLRVFPIMVELKGFLWIYMSGQHSCFTRDIQPCGKCSLHVQVLELWRVYLHAQGCASGDPTWSSRTAWVRPFPGLERRGTGFSFLFFLSLLFARLLSRSYLFFYLKVPSCSRL